MIKKLMSYYKNLEKKAHIVLKYGLEFCFILCLLSVLILFIYDTVMTSPTIFYIGISLFKLSLIFGIEFIICALVVDSIKKQVI